MNQKAKRVGQFLSMRHDYYSRGYFFERLDGAIFFQQSTRHKRCYGRSVIYYIFDEIELMHAGFRANSETAE